MIPALVPIPPEYDADVQRIKYEKLLILLDHAKAQGGIEGIRKFLENWRANTSRDRHPA